MQANVTFDNGETNRLTGFQGVDREKLWELSDDSVLELHKSGGTGCAARPLAVDAVIFD